MPLARNTVKDRIIRIAKNVTHQQNIDIKSANLISLYLDESTHTTGSAPLAIFNRCCNGNYVEEELISLVSL